MKKQVREITISCAYHGTESKSVAVPYIRLKGKLLQELGFLRGHKIRVQAIDKKLIITVEKSA